VIDLCHGLGLGHGSRVTKCDPLSALRHCGRVLSVAVLGGAYGRHLVTSSDCSPSYRDEASRRCADRFQNSLEELKFTGRQLSLDQRYNRTCLSVWVPHLLYTRNTLLHSWSVMFNRVSSFDFRVSKLEFLNSKLEF